MDTLKASERDSAAAVDPYAPLLWLVRNRLHQGVTLKQLVAKHRWKRKRVAVEAAQADALVAAVVVESSVVQQD